MKMLKWVSRVSITTLAAGLFITGLVGCSAKEGVTQGAAAETGGLSKKVEDVLLKRAELIRSEIASDARIIRLVRESSSKNKDLSLV